MLLRNMLWRLVGPSLIGAQILFSVYLTTQTWEKTCVAERYPATLPGRHKWIDRSEMIKDDEPTKKRRIYPQELLDQISKLRDVDYLPYSSPEEYEAELNQRLFHQQSAKDVGDPSKVVSELEVAGRLFIFLRPKKEYADLNPYITDLEGKEWVALFRDVFNCPMDLDEPYSPGDNLEERRERMRLKFQRAITGYPMLGRIWDTYADTIFAPEEVTQLRDECLKAEFAAEANQLGLVALKKLVSACDVALGSGAGLILESN